MWRKCQICITPFVPRMPKMICLVWTVRAQFHILPGSSKVPISSHYETWPWPRPAFVSKPPTGHSFGIQAAPPRPSQLPSFCQFSGYVCLEKYCCLSLTFPCKREIRIMEYLTRFKKSWAAKAEWKYHRHSDIFCTLFLFLQMTQTHTHTCQVNWRSFRHPLTLSWRVDMTRKGSW